MARNEIEMLNILCFLIIPDHIKKYYFISPNKDHMALFKC